MYFSALISHAFPILALSPLEFILISEFDKVPKMRKTLQSVSVAAVAVDASAIEAIRAVNAVIAAEEEKTPQRGYEHDDSKDSVEGPEPD